MRIYRWDGPRPVHLDLDHVLAIAPHEECDNAVALTLAFRDEPLSLHVEPEAYRTKPGGRTQEEAKAEGERVREATRAKRDEAMGRLIEAWEAKSERATTGWELWNGLARRPLGTVTGRAPAAGFARGGYVPEGSATGRTSSAASPIAAEDARRSVATYLRDRNPYTTGTEAWTAYRTAVDDWEGRLRTLFDLDGKPQAAPTGRAKDFWDGYTTSETPDDFALWAPTFQAYWTAGRRIAEAERVLSKGGEA